MGKIYPDLAGAFTRTIGGTVYYLRFGENLARRKSVWSENRTFSDAQLLQQAKFRLLTTVGNSLREAVDAGFPGRKRSQSGANVFVQVNQGACEVTEGGEVSLDYGRVLCAKGNLRPPFVEVKRSAEGFVFTNRAVTERGHAMETDDRVMAVVFDPVNGYCLFSELCKRGDEVTETVALPDYWGQESPVVYVFAVSEDGKRASRSLYLVPEEGD